MFFHVFVCLKILHCFTGLNIDPMIEVYFRINLNLVLRQNDEIRNILHGISDEINESEMEKYVSVISYYLDIVKENINSVHHPLLTHFVCLIFYLVHHKDTDEPIIFDADLLFNIVTFSKLYEYTKCNREMNDIIKTKMIMLFKSGMETKENMKEILKSKVIRLNELETDCPLIINNIKSSFDLDNNMDFQIIKNMKVKFKDLQSWVYVEFYLKSGSFESIYSFFIYLKLCFLIEKWQDLNSETIGFSLNDFFLDSTFWDQLRALNPSLTPYIFLKFDRVTYKDFIKFISATWLNKILNESSSFDSIFEFSEEKFFYGTANISRKFPENFIEFFKVKPYENQINMIYSLLIDISKSEFHQYIPIVFILKFFCFKKVTSNSEILLRVILECIFYMHILSTERNNCNTFSPRKAYEDKLFSLLEKNLTSRNIKINIPVNRITLIQRYIPETFNFFENFILALEFANAASIIFFNRNFTCNLHAINRSASQDVYKNLKSYCKYLLDIELDKTIRLAPVTAHEHEPIPESITESDIISEYIPNSIPTSETKPKPKPKPKPKHRSKFLPTPEPEHENMIKPKTVPELLPESKLKHEQPVPKSIPKPGKIPISVPLQIIEKKQSKISPKDQNEKLASTSVGIKPEISPQTPSKIKIKNKNNRNKLENITKEDKDSTSEKETQSKTLEGKKKNIFKIILIVTLVFISIIGISAIGYWVYVTWKVQIN
ncbi:hypothetical protein CWI38_1077p0020 [Hamiltosporidium tvaerminnensis]|uniref:Uncharacterized protein n=1 Tax=Hamiltosporidium tvaerminnensis TaxID=1176355 RepID=A0A4Q9LTQ5_9MICR|nr:hypothetical protein CWI38_1077p0020 [Hamiltosporidium tvaerminnensis]